MAYMSLFSPFAAMLSSIHNVTHYRLYISPDATCKFILKMVNLIDHLNSNSCVEQYLEIFRDIPDFALTKPSEVMKVVNDISNLSSDFAV